MFFWNVYSTYIRFYLLPYHRVLAIFFVFCLFIFGVFFGFCFSFTLFEFKKIDKKDTFPHLFHFAEFSDLPNDINIYIRLQDSVNYSYQSKDPKVKCKNYRFLRNSTKKLL